MTGFTVDKYCHTDLRDSIVSATRHFNLAGDLLECGTARGNSAVLMGPALKQMGDRRRLWVLI